MRSDIWYDPDKVYTFEEFSELYWKFYKYTRRSNCKILVFEWHQYNIERMRKIDEV